MDIVSIEVPNRRIVDENGLIARDRADVSDFYKANSALYVSAFRDVGILDLAFAQKSEGTERELTHGLRFTRFSERTWNDDIRLVPYNAFTERQGALTDAVLSQLEPIPALRRDDVVAGDIEKKGPPRPLLAIEALFPDSAEPARSTSVLLNDPERMPPPPTNIVLSLRAEDITDESARQIVKAVAQTRSHFTSAHVHTRYLSDTPVRGDESALPPVILYDIELRLKHESTP